MEVGPGSKLRFLSRIITTEPSEDTSVLKMSVLDVEGLQSADIKISWLKMQQKAGGQIYYW